jgi:hypothetical protein
MAVIRKMEDVLRALNKAKLKYGPRRPSVIVGYTARYALYVHEMVDEKGKKRVGEGIKRRRPSLGMYWDPQGKGQSKFLEEPFLKNRKNIGKEVVRVTKATDSLVFGLLAGGQMLENLSRELVPVNLGNLKASSFTRKE